MDENKNYNPNNEEMLNQNPYDPTVSTQNGQPSTPYQNQYQQQPQPQQPYQPQQPVQQQYQQPYQQQYQQSQQQYQANNYNTPPQYGQQPYQPNNYNAAPMDPEEKTAKNFGITSLVLGIVSLFCCGILTSIPGLIFGIISITKKKENNGMAIAGIIISAIGLIATIVAIVVIVSHPEWFRTYYRVYY